MADGDRSDELELLAEEIVETAEERDQEGTSLRTSEKMEVLVGIYEQLDQNHHHHNKIIFQTYYLSVIFFGAIGSAVLSGGQSDEVVAGIALFGSLVMFMLWFWAYMYLQGRRQIKESKANILAELSRHDDEFETMEHVSEAFFFRHDETPERSALAVLLSKLGVEVEGDFLGVETNKDTAQWAYFLLLGLVFAAAAVYVLL